MYATILLEPGDPLFDTLMGMESETTLRVGNMSVSIHLTPHSTLRTTHIKISGKVDQIIPMVKHLLLYQGRLTTENSRKADDLLVAITDERNRLCQLMSGRDLEE